VQSNEGSGIGKEDLCEVQGHYAQRRRAGDLRERKAQAAPGISKSWQEGKFRDKQGTGNRKQGIEKPVESAPSTISCSLVPTPCIQEAS
jgi:hypothetical protein